MFNLFSHCLINIFFYSFFPKWLCRSNEMNIWKSFVSSLRFPRSISYFFLFIFNSFRLIPFYYGGTMGKIGFWMVVIVYHNSFSLVLYEWFCVWWNWLKIRYFFGKILVFCEKRGVFCVFKCSFCGDLLLWGSERGTFLVRVDFLAFLE